MSGNAAAIPQQPMTTASRRGDIAEPIPRRSHGYTADATNKASQASATSVPRGGDRGGAHRAPDSTAGTTK